MKIEPAFGAILPLEMHQQIQKAPKSWAKTFFIF